MCWALSLRPARCCRLFWPVMRPVFTKILRAFVPSCRCRLTLHCRPRSDTIALIVGYLQVELSRSRPRPLAWRALAKVLPADCLSQSYVAARLAWVIGSSRLATMHLLWALVSQSCADSRRVLRSCNFAASCLACLPGGGLQVFAGTLPEVPHSSWFRLFSVFGVSFGSYYILRCLIYNSCPIRPNSGRIGRRGGPGGLIPDR